MSNDSHNSNQRSIDRLKQDAKALAKKENIQLYEAQNRIALSRGFSSWKHLTKDYNNSFTSDDKDKEGHNADSAKSLAILVKNNMPRDLLEKNISTLSRLGIDYSLLRPTSTCLKKSIIDAIGSVRIFFYTYGYHDYGSQLQGPENKILKEAIIVTNKGPVKTKVSLYRPKTKQGDPRIWVYKLSDFTKADDVIALILKDKLLHVINLSQIDLSQHEQFLNNLYEQINSTANELLEKLRKLASAGPITPTRVFVGDTAIGMAIEEALEVEPNSSKKPDYKGIELKTARKLSNTRSTIFAQVAEWSKSVIKSSSEMLNKYGYPRDDDFKLYCTVKANVANSQGLFFITDMEKDVLNEFHESDGQLLTWSGNLLRSRLLEKHKETFWIEAESFFNDSGVECFVLKKIIHTKNPLVSQLLPLLENGVITMDHLIKKKGSTGQVSEKGPLFKIDPRNLHLLFPEPVFYII